MTASEKFVANVYAVCKGRNIPLCDLEKEIGVSAGYFSRAKAAPRNISVNIVRKTADVFEMSIGDLVEGDMAKRERIRELEQTIQVYEDCLEKARNELAELNPEPETIIIKRPGRRFVIG